MPENTLLPRCRFLAFPCFPLLLTGLLCGLLGSCRSNEAPGVSLNAATQAHAEALQELDPDALHDAQAIHGLIDAWHLAASEVRAEDYLGTLSEDAIFMGTDPGERWDKLDFSAYVEHYFLDQGVGWTYLPSRREVMFSPSGNLAWFDEHLVHAGYGVLRGTGVVRLEAAGWRICHYSMTFAIPNDQSEEVVNVLKKSVDLESTEGSPQPADVGSETR